MARETLTEKQRRFVEAFMGQAKGNATEAARLAGYKGNAKTLKQVGAENLAKPYLRKAIKARQDADPLVLSRKQVQELLTRIALGEEKDSVPSDGQEIKVSPAMRDRLKALDLLAKTGGYFMKKRPNPMAASELTDEQLKQFRETGSIEGVELIEG